MKHLLLALLLCGSATQAAEVASPYPNELPNFQLWNQARWKGLLPLVSTIHDVRKLLGEPTSAVDLDNYSAPYPGDDKARAPVLTYMAGTEWKILVYFVKSDYRARIKYPETLYDRLLSIDICPVKPISFKEVKFPSLFKSIDVTAADASWKEYSDGSGLVYEVYTTHPPYGDKQPGDLFRIVYGASDDTVKALSKKAEQGAPSE